MRHGFYRSGRSRSRPTSGRYSRHETRGNRAACLDRDTFNECEARGNRSSQLTQEIILFVFREADSASVGGKVNRATACETIAALTSAAQDQLSSMPLALRTSSWAAAISEQGLHPLPRSPSKSYLQICSGATSEPTQCERKWPNVPRRTYPWESVDRLHPAYGAAGVQGSPAGTSSWAVLRYLLASGPGDPTIR